MYKTTELRQFFNVSRQTISAWCNEFAEYLSPTATPVGNTHRQLTDDDLEVLALVSEMSRASRPFAEIHLALRSGQRGEIPLTSNDLVPLDTSTQLSLYRTQILELQSRIDEIEREKDEAVGRAKELREQFAQAQAKIHELYQKMARLEVQIPRKADD